MTHAVPVHQLQPLYINWIVTKYYSDPVIPLLHDNKGNVTADGLVPKAQLTQNVTTSIMILYTLLKMFKRTRVFFHPTLKKVNSIIFVEMVG